MPTLEELKKSRKSIENVNVRHQQSLARVERFAVWITDHIGTMGFFFLILTWTILWLLWNIFTPAELHFDPFPAFVLWLFVSNVIQLFLLPLIMIGQNLQERHAALRAETDFEVNLKAEKEIEAILSKLEEQNESILKILKKLEDSNR